MKKFWIRWLVIIAVFFGAMYLFSIILNKGTTDMTVEMQDASLPIVSVVYGSKSVNTMHGYVERMDNGTVRDGISPIGEDRTLDFVVDTYSTAVNKVSYEIRSMDGSRLIEDTVVGEYEGKRGQITGTVNIKDLIVHDEEYNLNFILNLADGREVYYYTKIICSNDLEVESKMDFILDFNEKTFSEEGIKEIGTFMEPNSDADNTTLGYVDIHSSKRQLGWGNSTPRKIGNTEFTICEISKNRMSAKLEYMVSVEADEIKNFYRVEEFYAIRQGTERNYLLDFSRTMDDVFLPDKDSLVNNKIVLGIQSKPSKLYESEDGNILVLENCGRLYSYDVSGNKMATLYSFFKAGDVDERNIFNKSKAKVLNVEENGNVTFMIYGYMNRGTHEGQVGVLVEYYNSVLNTIEEQIFIKYNKSADLLMADVEKLSFLNQNNDIYVVMDGNIVSANLESLQLEVVAENIIEDSLCVSASNRLAVWEDDGEKQGELRFIDMKTGEMNKIESSESEYLTPIGFMNEDLIYGVSQGDNIINNVIGDNTLLMDKIVIRNGLSTIVKEYTFDDVYVVEGQIADNQITLKRARRNEDGTYTELNDDQITYNENITVGKNVIKRVATEKFDSINQIELKRNIDSKSLKFLTPKEVLYEGGKVISNEKSTNNTRYILYVRGHIKAVHSTPAMAVETALENRGYVVDNHGNEIYRRGEIQTKNQIMAINDGGFSDEKTSLVVCLEAILKHRGVSRNVQHMLSGDKKPYEILEENLQDAYVLNLSGCKMDVATYYLDKDIPVLAVLNNGDTMLLVGYNEQNTVLFDPMRKEVYKMGMNDSREFFEQNGNRFLTYCMLRAE